MNVSAPVLGFVLAGWFGSGVVVGFLIAKITDPRPR